jgi:hypothetical protein
MIALYETTTGTPVSPTFRTAGALIGWLEENGLRGFRISNPDRDFWTSRIVFSPCLDRDPGLLDRFSEGPIVAPSPPRW